MNCIAEFLLFCKTITFHSASGFCWTKIPSAHYASGSRQMTESPLSRRGGVNPPASKKSEQPLRRHSSRRILFSSCGAVNRRTGCARWCPCPICHAPLQTGGLTPPLRNQREPEYLCNAGKIVFPPGYFPISVCWVSGICKTRKI